MREFRSGPGLEALVTRMGAEAVVLLLRKLSGACPSSQPWVTSPLPGSPGTPSAVPTGLSLFLRNRTCLIRTKALGDPECPDGTPCPSQTVSGPALGPGQAEPTESLCLPYTMTSALCSCQSPSPPAFLSKPGHAWPSVASGQRAVAVMPAPGSNSHVLTGRRAQAGVPLKHKRHGLAFSAPSRESGIVCPASLVCSTAVTLTKPCAHSSWHLVNLGTPEASPRLLLLKVTDSVCHAHWHFFAHEDKRPVSAVLGSQLCVRDGRGSGLCSVKGKRKHSSSPRCHGVWALVEPSFSRTQSTGDGAGGQVSTPAVSGGGGVGRGTA